MSLLTDLQAIAEHLSPSDYGNDPLVGALIKVLEHQGVTAPSPSELLPEEHPSQIQPPAPAAPAASPAEQESRLQKIEELLGQLVHGSSDSPADTAGGSETSESSGPELDRP